MSFCICVICVICGFRFSSFKRRDISLEIKELVRSTAHHAAKPKRFSEHLFEPAHDCISGFISDTGRQPGLVPYIIIQPAEQGPATRQNDPAIIYVCGYFGRKLGEGCRYDVDYLANDFVSDGIDFPGGDFDCPRTAGQDIATGDRDLLCQVVRQSRGSQFKFKALRRLLSNDESAVAAHMINKCCVDVPASDSLGLRVNHGAVRDNGYTGSRLTEVDDRRGASVVYFDTATQGRGQAIFDHANAANTRLFSGV